MYRETSTSEEYPKTLLIRNTVGGMVWQVYHVEKESEAMKLSDIATLNGFQDCELTDYKEKWEQTWPDWRETSGGKEICRETEENSK